MGGEEFEVKPVPDVFSGRFTVGSEKIGYKGGGSENQFPEPLGPLGEVVQNGRRDDPDDRPDCDAHEHMLPSHTLHEYIMKKM